jgi:hypothetical protein
MTTTITPYQPSSIAELEQLCARLCRSGMVPRAYQGKPADAFVAIAFGAEVGLPPLASLQHIAVIDGRPGLFGDAIAGVALKSGAIKALDEWFEGEHLADTWTAVCEVTRPDGGKVKRTFSVADAKRAKLWGKLSRESKPSPWVLYPQRMLAARARGFAVRDAAPHSFMGYTAEELRDVQEQERAAPKDITPAGEPSAPTVDIKPEAGLLEVIHIVGGDGKPVYVGNVWQEALRFYGETKRHSTDAFAVARANLQSLKIILPYTKNGTRGRLLAEIEAIEAMGDGEILERPPGDEDEAPVAPPAASPAEETPPHEEAA